MMSPTEISPELRKLIDARLDVIDRILVQAAISWSERQNIVGEVETQIFELLARRGGIPTQGDVTEILQSLDPPESYLPDGTHGEPPVPPPVATSITSQWLRKFQAHAAEIGVAAALVTGLVVVNGVVLVVVAASDGAIQWVVTLGAIAWADYAAVKWLRTWSAEHRGHLLDEARKSLAAWLSPKDEPVV